MATTDIEWADRVWNLTRGCWMISPGCLNCYAMLQAHRFNFPGGPYEGLTELGNYGPRWSGKGLFVTEKLAEPLSWKKPCRVFVNSMSDLFYEEFTDQQIAAAFGVMACCPHITFMVLTKRARRMEMWFSRMAKRTSPLRVCGDAAEALGAPVYRLGRGGRSPWNRSLCRWPLPNIWLGVSAEDQERADERIPRLLETPAAVRFVSAEPLLEPLDLRQWLRMVFEIDPRLNLPVREIRQSLDWVIAGVESGARARPAELPWFRSLRDQCKGAGTKYFLKQLADAEGRRGSVVSLPVLDDRQWVEFPEVAA